MSLALWPSPQGARCECGLSSVSFAGDRGSYLGGEHTAHSPLLRLCFVKSPNVSTHLIVCTVLPLFEWLGFCCKVGFCHPLAPHFSGVCNPLECLGRGRMGRAPTGVQQAGARCGSRGGAGGALLSQQPSHREEFACQASRGRKTNTPAPALTGLPSS